MANPEFQMKGIRFVISATTNAGHPLPFKVKTADGKWVELQRSFRESFTAADVVNELRLLALTIETAAQLVTPLMFRGIQVSEDPTLP